MGKEEKYDEAGKHEETKENGEYDKVKTKVSIESLVDEITSKRTFKMVIVFLVAPLIWITGSINAYLPVFTGTYNCLSVL